MQWFRIYITRFKYQALAETINNRDACDSIIIYYVSSCPKITGLRSKVDEGY